MFEHYAEYEYLFARIQIVLFMLGMGATLSAADFIRVFRHLHRRPGLSVGANDGDSYFT